MFEFDNFIEIQVGGILLILSLSPLIILADKRMWEREGICPPLIGLKSNTAQTVLVLVASFVLGITGSRLVDELVLSPLDVEGKEWFDCSYKVWLAEGAGDAGVAADKTRKCEREFTSPFTSPVTTVFAPGDQKQRPSQEAPAPPRVRAAGRNDYADNSSLKLAAGEQPPDPPQDLRLAEYELGRVNDYARAYIERHKSFMRVLRAAALAAALFLLAMVIHEWSRRKGSRDTCDRYLLPLYALTGFALILLTVTYAFESMQVYKRVCELSTGVPDCEFGSKKPEPLYHWPVQRLLLIELLMIATVLLARFLLRLPLNRKPGPSASAQLEYGAFNRTYIRQP